MGESLRFFSWGSKAGCVPACGEGEGSGEGLGCCGTRSQGWAGDGGLEGAVDTTTVVATRLVSQLDALSTHVLPQPMFQAVGARLGCRH